MLATLRNWIARHIAKPDPYEAPPPPRLYVGPEHPCPCLLEVWRVEPESDGALLIDHAMSMTHARLIARRRGPGGYAINTEGGKTLALIVVQDPERCA